MLKLSNRVIKKQAYSITELNRFNTLKRKKNWTNRTPLRELFFRHKKEFSETIKKELFTTVKNGQKRSTLINQFFSI